MNPREKIVRQYLFCGDEGRLLLPEEIEKIYEKIPDYVAGYLYGEKEEPSTYDSMYFLPPLYIRGFVDGGGDPEYIFDSISDDRSYLGEFLQTKNKTLINHYLENMPSSSIRYVTGVTMFDKLTAMTIMTLTNLPKRYYII